MYNLEDFERVVWREPNSIQKFIKYFLFDDYLKASQYHLSLVLWSTTDMLVEYTDISTNEKYTSLFSIEVWKDYYYLANRGGE